MRVSAQQAQNGCPNLSRDQAEIDRNGMNFRRLMSLAILLALPICAWSEPAVHTAHGLTLFGELKYGPEVTHFDYVNPDAPKGGTYRMGLSSTFDNLNPFIIAGTAPILTLPALVYETLMVRSADEPASVYGLVAESVTYPDDYSWAEFKLRDEARWHDGTPITPEDVIFSLETLKTKGSPQFRANYADIVNAEITGPRTVRFTFRGGDKRGTLYTAAQLVLLPKHYWQDRDFTKPSIDPPLTSGPYRVGKVDPGRLIVYERVKDYWARDLPINKGRHNFDEIRHDYYRDITIEHEALLAGNVDLRWETLPVQWATGYNVDAVREGRLIKEMLPFSGTTMYAGYFFNLRKKKFQDARVREAIANAYDFEWLNRMLFYGMYIRMQSHFENSELAAKGVPTGKELEILEKYRDRLPEKIFTEEYHSPSTDGTRASLRENLRDAVKLLQEAGWTIRDGRLVSESGEPFEFEIITWDPFFERVTGPFIANLELLGITARQRTIDTAQWFNRMQNFDFDVSVAFHMPQFMSPGAEQREFWGSEMADQVGGRNYNGIKNPIVDDLIEVLINAPDRETRVAATRALDRVLLWNFYSIPNYYAPGIHIVYWDRFGRPEIDGTWLSSIWTMSTWWVDPEKDATLKAWRKES
jgi:microcin C transport system substrate-binding protein